MTSQLNLQQLPQEVQALALMVTAVVLIISPTAKTLVDIARQAKPGAPGHTWPLLALTFTALIIGLACVALMATGIVQVVALCLLVAIFGVPYAMGITAAQNSANRAVEHKEESRRMERKVDDRELAREAREHELRAARPRPPLEEVP